MTNNNLNFARPKLNEKISVDAVEAIGGGMYLLVHEYNPHELCLNVPNFGSGRLHWIKRAITFNAYNPLITELEKENAKQAILRMLTDNDINFINKIFNSAVENDYADYIEGADYFKL